MKCTLSHRSKNPHQNQLINVGIFATAILFTCDFLLFSHIKQYILGKRFSSNEEVVPAVYFDNLPHSHLRDGIHEYELEDHWNKIIDVQEENIE